MYHTYKAIYNCYKYNIDIRTPFFNGLLSLKRVLCFTQTAFVLNASVSASSTMPSQSIAALQKAASIRYRNVQCPFHVSHPRANRPKAEAHAKKRFAHKTRLRYVSRNTTSTVWSAVNSKLSGRSTTRKKNHRKASAKKKTLDGAQHRRPEEFTKELRLRTSRSLMVRPYRWGPIVEATEKTAIVRLGIGSEYL